MVTLSTLFLTSRRMKYLFPLSNSKTLKLHPKMEYLGLSYHVSFELFWIRIKRQSSAKQGRTFLRKMELFFAAWKEIDFCSLISWRKHYFWYAERKWEQMDSHRFTTWWQTLKLCEELFLFYPKKIHKNNQCSYGSQSLA